MKIEEKILTLRKKNGFSQEELAQQLGVTRQAVYKWESGNAFPEIDKVRALAKLFSVSFDYLLDDTIEEYDSSKNDTKVLYRDVYLLGDKQDFMQGDIDHGYIKERHSRNSMSATLFARRRKSVQRHITKAGATEMCFFSEEETVAYFYDSNKHVIGFYYGDGIQLVCPIENLVSFNVSGGDPNIVNSQSTILGISNNGIGVGSIPNVSVQGSYPINITVMYHDGDVVKNFSFKILTASTYLYYEQKKAQVEIFNNILRLRLTERIAKIKAKIDTMIFNSAVLVTEKTPEINIESYREINAEAKAEYSEYVKKLENEVSENNNRSAEIWMKLGIWMLAGLAALIFMPLIIIPILLLLGIIPANIAKCQGKNYFSWWMYGSFLFPVAIIHLSYLGIKKKVYGSENFTEEKRKKFENFERVANIVLLSVCAVAMICLTVYTFIKNLITGAILLLCQIIGFVIAYKAGKKGKNISLWWIYGTFLLLIAAIHLAFVLEE